MNVNQWTKEWAEAQNLNFNFFPSIESTNTACKRQAFISDEPFYLCFADHQTEGRGRFDRSWSDHGKGAYFLSSWSFRVDASAHPLITARIGLSVIESLIKTFQVPLSLKAPNDIYIDLKKTAGILTESISQGNKHRLIIGFGLNVFEAPQEQSQATALSSILKSKGTEINKNNWALFLEELRSGFENVSKTADQSSLSALEQSALLKHLNEFSGLNEKYVQITADGRLVTATQNISWMDL